MKKHQFLWINVLAQKKPLRAGFVRMQITPWRRCSTKAKYRYKTMRRTPLIWPNINITYKKCDTFCRNIHCILCKIETYKKRLSFMATGPCHKVWKYPFNLLIVWFSIAVRPLEKVSLSLFKLPLMTSKGNQLKTYIYSKLRLF